MTPPALEVVCLGECMIELRPQAPGLLAQGFAGDVYNTAVYLKRLDLSGALRVHCATGVGSDSFADDMLEAWREEGVETDLVRRVPDRSTGLYSIRTDAHGERHFSYWRERSAARAYFDGEPSPLETCADRIDLLYLSGISLAVMSSVLQSRLPALLDKVRESGGRIAFDNNYRPRLWSDAQAARAAFAALYALADIALVTLDDEAAMNPGGSEAAALDRILALPCPEIVVKRGAESTLVRVTGEAPIEIAARQVKDPVDTTAAGDSFAAGYLFERLLGGGPGEAAELGNRLAAEVICHPGAIVPRTATAAIAAAAAHPRPG